MKNFRHHNEATEEGKNLYVRLVLITLIAISMCFFGEELTNNKVFASSTTDVWEIGSAGRPTVDAIDVSSYQSWMTQDDYSKLKSLGVKSVIVKVTEGQTYKNPYASTQVAYAKNAGMNIDVYHFVRFKNSTEAVEEANNVIAEMKSLNLAKNTLIFADVEDTTLGSSVGSNLQTFWNTLQSSGYSNHGVYTYKYYYARDQVVNTVGKARTWIAEYPYHPSSSNLQDQEYGAWQFSSTATFKGNSVDVSIDYGGLLSNTAATTSSSTTTVPTVIATPTEKTTTTTESSSSTTTKVTGFQYIASQNKTVYYNANGQMLYGQQYINGKWYLFDSSTGAMKTGFQYISNQHKTVYYNGNGQMLYGQQYINGKWYLFDSSTGAMKTGFQYISNQHKMVYYNGNGQMLYGQQYINGKWYLFDSNTGAMKTGFQYISNQHKTVYYNGNGQMLYGKQFINGKWYTFDKNTGAMKK